MPVTLFENSGLAAVVCLLASAALVALGMTINSRSNTVANATLKFGMAVLVAAAIFGWTFFMKKLGI